MADDSPIFLAREFNRRYAGRPVSMHAARKWLIGESIPTQDKLRVLAQWLGVTADWLRFGEGEVAAARGDSPSPPPAGCEVDFDLARRIHRHHVIPPRT